MAKLDAKRFYALGCDWTARFDFNAICTLEEVTGEGFGAIVGPFLGALDEKDREDPKVLARLVSKIRASHLRAILFVALLGEHEDATPALAGRIIGELGLAGAMPVIAWAIVRGLGLGDDAEDGLEGGAGEGDDAAGAANPPKAKPRKRAA